MEIIEWSAPQAFQCPNKHATRVENRTVLIPSDIQYMTNTHKEDHNRKPNTNIVSYGSCVPHVLGKDILSVFITLYLTTMVRSKVSAAFSPPSQGRLYSIDMLLVPFLSALNVHTS